METITKVNLTALEKQSIENAEWGCYTYARNVKVGRTLARLLTEGFVAPSETHSLIDVIRKESGVNEVSDTACRERILGAVEDILGGAFPHLDENEWDDERDGDEDA
jgi:hypothetical protein